MEIYDLSLKTQFFMLLGLVVVLFPYFLFPWLQCSLVADGSLLLCTPIDPLFLALPYLVKAGKVSAFVKYRIAGIFRGGKFSHKPLQLYYSNYSRAEFSRNAPSSVKN